MTDRAMIAAMCLSLVASLSGIMTYPALLPMFQDLWSLSNADAGWIAGVYFVGYVAAVAVLTSLTDRYDARIIFLISALTGAIGAAGFAFLADGIVSASIWRCIQGAGLAGCYMPGLRILTDRVSLRGRSRAVSFYTAIFVSGSSLSYFLAGVLEPSIGWRWTYGLMGLGPALAFAVVLLVFRPVHREPRPIKGLFDYRPVLRNRAALSFTLAYACHSWELYTLRTWMVAYIAFLYATAAAGSRDPLLSPTEVAALGALAGTPASIIGNELADRFNRRILGMVLMGASALIGLAVAFADLSVPLAVAIIFIFYTFWAMTESSVVTGGCVAAADERYMGVTMAFHSVIGFSASFIGPITFGYILDAGGGETVADAWSNGFLMMGAVMALGPLCLLWGIRAVRPEPVSKER